MSFPRYPKYKPSGVEWLGDVPEHWEVTRLKYVAPLITDRADTRENPIALENIEGWTGRLIATDSDFQGDGIGFNRGDILFGKLRPYLAKIYLATVDGEAVGDFHILRPRPGAHGKFVQYSMMRREFVAVVDGTTFGSKMPRASWESVGGMPTLLPPESEQRAIAAFLDRETAKIDALVAEQQQLIELLKEKRQAVISHAVTKGLDPKAPMKPSGVEWLGDVPAHWEVKRLRGLFRQTKRQDQDSKPVLSVYRDLGVVLKDSRDDNNNKTPEDLSLYQLVQPGDLVVNKMKAWQGSLGISSIEGITSPDYAVFLPRHAEESAFLHLLLRSAAMVSQYLRISNGIRLDQWRLETDLFLNMGVCLPSRDEQRLIAETLCAKLRQVDDLAAEAASTITLLQERRSALISAAVTGQIDVRNAVTVEVA